MHLSELEFKEGEIVEDEYEEEVEEEDDEDSTEVDLQNALLLLRDAGELFGILASKGRKQWPNIINQYVGRQIAKMGQEIEAYLSDFEMGDDNNGAA